ncbi:MAG: hypothetical protein IJ632_01405 [Muribaculaceae bacterium]|nr:hypothetical protein [Muribaculaceae bacterium]
MEQYFNGKKLLVLGSNIGSVEIVNYAKAHGAHTIVADYFEPEKSAAKRVADEQAFISTANVTELSQLIKTRHIDGVLAGISEFNLLKAQELCMRNGLPFYCNRQQWDTIENKVLFRDLCERHGVPTPRTLFKGDAGLASAPYCPPVVVKPDDSNSSRGVAFCIDNESQADAIAQAARLSSDNRVIIEEFFQGEEFTAHYMVNHGKAFLACIDNRFPVALHDDKTTIPIARVYPCRYADRYMEKVNPRVVSMIESLGLECAVIFVQGLYDKNSERFAIFEGGLRCAGEAAYRITDHLYGVNFLHNLVDYSLLGTTARPSMESMLLTDKRVACVLSFAARGGTIAEITGVEGVTTQLPSLIHFEQRYHEGDTLPEGDTLRQIVLRFTLVCDSLDELKRHIDLINSSVAVLDAAGNDLCVRFDSSQLLA